MRPVSFFLWFSKDRGWRVKNVTLPPYINAPIPFHSSKESSFCFLSNAKLEIEEQSTERRQEQIKVTCSFEERPVDELLHLSFSLHSTNGYLNFAWNYILNNRTPISVIRILLWSSPLFRIQPKKRDTSVTDVTSGDGTVPISSGRKQNFT